MSSTIIYNTTDIKTGTISQSPLSAERYCARFKELIKLIITRSLYIDGMPQTIYIYIYIYISCRLKTALTVLCKASQFRIHVFR